MMTKQFTIITAVIAAAVAGCVQTNPDRLSESHPANPAAPSAAYPPLTPFLMSDTNLAMMTLASTNMPTDGNQHEMNPAPNNPHKHDHH